MSDIRAEARRDAEFDRLLSERACANPSKAKYTGEDMQAAHELGKRHGAEMIKGNRRPLSDERKAYAQLEETE